MSNLKRQIYQIFQDNFSIMLLIDAENGEIIEANRAACKFYGYSHQELTQKNINQINILPKNKIKQELKNAKTGNKNYFQFKHRLASGEIKDVEIYSNTIIYKKKETLLSIIHDITELKKQETENQKAQFSLIEAEKIAKIGHWEFNLTTKKVKASEGARKIYGLGLNNEHLTIEQTQDLTLKKYKNILDKALSDLIIYNKTYNIEFEIKRKNDGQIRIIHSIAEYIKEENTVFGIIKDITETKKTELELKKQNEEYAALNEEYKTINEKLIIAKNKAEESDKLKTEFIHNMSHEIRTPMNGILGFADFLNKPNLSAEKRKQYINIIQQSGKQLMQIIDDILEISKLETKQVETIKTKINLNNLLLELFDIFKDKAKEAKINLYLKKELPDNESFIFSDRYKLNKALSNLLDNAFKFTSKGFVEFGYAKVKNKIKIYVADTGIGINPENTDAIFDYFSQEEKSLTRNVGGLGLGLSIAQKNVELIGGTITVQSKKGKGTTFFITIPH